MADNLAVTIEEQSPTGNNTQGSSTSGIVAAHNGPPPPIGFTYGEKPPPYPGVQVGVSQQMIATSGYPQPPPPAYPGFPEQRVVIQQPGMASCQFQYDYGNHQPATVVIAQRQVTPPSQMCLSCTVLWFCCFPLGLIACVYSSQVSNRYANGDYEGSVAASHRARVWGNLGFFIGLCLWTCLLVWLFI